MNTAFESFINYLTVFFDRSGIWFLSGEALANFVCSGSIDGCAHIEIGMLDTTPDKFLDRCTAFGIAAEKIGDGVYLFKRDSIMVEVQLFSVGRKGILECPGKGYRVNRGIIQATDQEVDELRRKRPEMAGNGLWRRQVDELHPQYLCLPCCYGTLLDLIFPEWYVKTPRRPFPKTGEIFFNENRRENGRKLISGLYKAAESAGISDRLFIGFGTMLGYIMYGDFIAKDRDMDMCIVSDGLTAEQTDKYAEFAYNVDDCNPPRWECSKREDTGKMLWFSVGYKNQMAENGTKSCNWFFYSWNGYWWHSKGGKWVNPRKINEKVGYSMSDQAIALGLPTNCINSLTEVDFGGINVKIPTTPGSCLDVWYPGWNPKGEGASAHRNIQVVGKWDDENTWRMA
jgi:hypothetical protein